MKTANPTLRRLLLILLIVVTVHSSLNSTANSTEPKNDNPAANSNADQEYYEIRVYKIYDFDKQQAAESYLENALVPALNRMGLDRIGVFTNLGDENDHSMYMLIPYPSVEKFTAMNETLAADKEYQAASANYFARKLKDPVFDRIESRFLKAFSGMPVIETPAVSKEKKERIFELRLYQSHTEDHARRKVKMFNEGEIQIMRDTELGPVFFGETLIGPDVPNLVYMLSSSDEESHKQHWKSFLGHPEWKRIKDLEEYKGTVSKIQKWFLQPTKYSQL
ncbi:MAG: NIPSNAP family protein [Mariniblastus sp.]|nr:NIPSNAP family protein [Mariniblastus sp.]